MKIGPGIEDPDLGPLISERQLRARAADARDSARGRGATRDSAASTTAACSCSPALVTDVTPDMEIFQEEVFGPVLVAVPFDDERDADRSWPTRPPTGSSRACGRRTSPARTASPRASAPGRCSSTATASAAGSSCPSAAWAARGYGRGKGIEALLAYTPDQERVGRAGRVMRVQWRRSSPRSTSSQDELVALLQRLIRLPTVNPPGEAYEAFVADLRGVLDGYGYATEVHHAPHRARAARRRTAAPEPDRQAGGRRPARPSQRPLRRRPGRQRLDARPVRRRARRRPASTAAAPRT